MTVSNLLHISKAPQTLSEGSAASKQLNTPVSPRIRLTLSKPHIEDVVAPYAQLMFNTQALSESLMLDESDLTRIAMSFFHYYETHQADTLAEIAQKREAAKALVEAHIKEQNYEKWIESRLLALVEAQIKEQNYEKWIAARLLEELHKASQAHQVLNVERVERATTLDYYVSALFCRVYAADVVHGNRYFIDFINSSSDVLNDFITSYFKNGEV